MITTLQEKIEHWVFTLVGGDSGFDNFILELHKQPEPKSYLTTDMQNICERDTTTAFHDEMNFEKSIIVITDNTAVNCCTLEKGWDNIAQDPYISPETVELDEVLYVLDR